MTRLSREQKRELKRAGRASAGLPPIDVRVSAEGDATVGGMPVPPSTGATLQTAALDYLHHLALATGHPVLATIHDERIGYVVPLQVHVDGSSHYAGEPVRVGEPRGFVGVLGGEGGPGAGAGAAREGAGSPVSEGAGAVAGGHAAAAPGGHAGAGVHGVPAAPSAAHAPVGEQATAAAAHLGEGTARWTAPEPTELPAAAQGPHRDKSTYVLRAVPESAAAGPELADAQARSGRPADTASHAEPEQAPAKPVAPAEPETRREPRTMPLTAAKEKQGQASEPAAGGVAPSTFVLRAVPEPTEGPPAQPPRAPGLPLTAPGIAVEPDSESRTPEPIQDRHPTAGTVSPPTGAFGLVTDSEPPLPPAQSTPQTWHPDQAPANTPPAAPASLEPQPWPPSRNAAPAQAPAHTSDAGSVDESRHVSPNPQTWPPAPANDPAPEPTPRPSPSPAPPHPSDSVPESGPVSLEPQPWSPTPAPVHTADPVPTPEPAPPALALLEESATDAYSAPEWKVLEEDSVPKPAPVREFDAVAEAVLDTAEEHGGTASPFAEPLSRINEAVKLGRIQEAAELAEQTVAQATATLGPQHPEVLRLRELTAYIAYLAGDALRSFHLSLDLAVLRHRLHDPRSAYGNIQSAAAAWRAVRDPLQGLHLGRDLIAVWTELAAEAGPAAEDLEQLEKARTRMVRLTERARALDDHGQ